jgi:NTP pyrophosphatase (non-canonical NTP hydrolase)
MSFLIEQVAQEAARADAKWGPLHSSHEGYGVLAEEVAELLDAIRANDLTEIRREAVQVSAVALRIAHACSDAAFVARSVPRD